MVKKEAKEPEIDRLIVSKDEAKTRLQKQIDDGEEISKLPIVNQVALEQALVQSSSWFDFTREVLLRIFSTNKMEQEFYWAERVTYRDDLANFRRIDGNLNKLKSILKRVDLYDDIAIPGRIIATAKPENISKKDVFIVHGTDETYKEKLARYLEKLKLNPIILHERPNQGKTIIEKLEYHAEVAFVAILLTPDDIGGSSSQADKLLLRARQNVILNSVILLAGSVGNECVPFTKRMLNYLPTSQVLYISLLRTKAPGNYCSPKKSKQPALTLTSTTLFNSILAPNLG